MKKFILVLLLNSLAIVFANEIKMYDLKLSYQTPSESYRTYIQESDKKMLLIKFPSIHSKNNNIDITPNLAVIAEKLPSNVDLNSYTEAIINNNKKYSTFHNNVNKNRIINSKIPYSYSFYQEYNDRTNIRHSVCIITHVQKSIGFYIIFDCTEDVFLELKPNLELIINSIKIEEN